MARLLDLLTLIASPFAAAIEQEFGGNCSETPDSEGCDGRNAHEGEALEAAPLSAVTKPYADASEVPVAVPVVVLNDLTDDGESSGCAEPAPAVKPVGHISYHPEMGEAKPEAEIEASLSHYGKHWFLRTPLTLKGRGITHLDTEPDHGQRRAGWHRYKVTGRAFELLGTRYRIVSEALL